MFARFSVKKPYTVIVGVIICLLLGTIAYTNMTVDLLPAMELPYMVVYTAYPGASGAKIEKSVTMPLESALGTTAGLNDISSISSDDMSMIVLEFSDGTNMDSALIDVNSKIDMVKGYFEDGTASPIVMSLNPDMLPIMEVAFYAKDGQDLESFSKTYENDILPQIEKIEGVASVTSIGLLEETVEIRLDQAKIDKINDKVLASVDSELYEAQKEINDGYAQLDESAAKIDEGLKQLESGQTNFDQSKQETIDKLAQTSAQLDSANAQLQGIAANESDLLTSQAALKAEKEMLTKMDEQLSALISAITALDDDMPIDDPTVETLLAALKQAGISFQAQNVGELKAELQTIVDTNSDRIKNIEIELQNIATEITGAKMAKEQLSAKIAQLNEAKTALEKGKIEASIELSNAQNVLSQTKEQLLSSKTQLDSAKAQLDEAQQQLTDAKAKAYEEADITGAITPSMIANILMAENFEMPAGTITQDDNTSILVKVGEGFQSIEEIADLTVMSLPIDGLEEIKLSDLADVDFTDNSAELYSKVNGQNGVIMTIEKQSIASTSAICEKINEKITDLTSEGDIGAVVFFDQGVYINMIVDSVINNLLQGGILAIVVLLLFLKDWKSTLVIGIAIPVSLMFAVVLMYFSGVTLNVVSLSGLALAVGMLVDNSIVVIENIYRLKGDGLPLTKAIVQGTNGVQGAIASSTLTTICVFLPIVFASGIAKQIFTDMGLTIAYSLLASLLIAVAVVPMLASRFMKKTQKTIAHPWFDKFVAGYEKLLTWSLAHKLLILGLAVLLLIGSVVKVASMGTSFMPQVASNQLNITLTMNDQNADLQETRQTADKLMDKMIAIEGISDFGVFQGAASMMSTSDEKVINIFALTTSAKISDDVSQKIMQEAQDLPATIEISSSNMDLSALGGSGVQIVLFGDDLDMLYDNAQNIVDDIEKIEGVSEASVGEEDDIQELRVIVDKNAAMHYGLTVAQVYSAIAQRLTNETSSTTVTIADDDYPIIIVNDDQLQRDPQALQDMLLEGTVDAQTTDVKLMDIAAIEQAQGAKAINRQNNQRTLTVNVTADEGYNIGLVGKEIEDHLTKIQLDDGIRYEISGETATINETLMELVKMIALAIVLIYLIMVAQFQDLLSPFIVMFTIPLAFTGGLLALIITNSDLSVIAMLGFLVLSGIVVNNGIVFVDTVNQLREDGMDKHDALIVTGKTRIRPILMTALTTILGLSTMALGIGDGAAMMAPLAIVTIGGLIYATIMTLFVVPILYALLCRRQRIKADV